MQLHRDVEGAGTSDGDVHLIPTPPVQNGKKKMHAALGATVLVAIAVVSAAALRRQPLNLQRDFTVLDTIWALKPRKNCSAGGENCMQSGCCQTSGAKCFKKDTESAWCELECDSASGWSCEEVTSKTGLEAAQPGTSMYCYIVNFKKKGGKPNKDVELMQMQMQRKLGIFACEAYDVFSDVPVVLGDYTAVQVMDVENDFCLYKRPDKPGTCANAAIFYQAWKKMRAMQTWRSQEWVIKVDADTVFIPQRLKDMLSFHAGPSQGVYYENCKGVDSGFFGSLEVVSTKGFETVVDKLENCKYTLCWGGQECDGWKYGPFGEDKFLQECMDLHGVSKLPLFELTYDGACPDDRPKDQKKNKKFKPPCWNSTAPATHPFKTVDTWLDCYAATTK